MDSISDRLALIMKEQGLNQSKLAEALTISPNSVSLWLRGKTKPSSQSIDQICSKYGYNRDWLLNGVGEPRSLATADQQVIDILAHAIKFKSTAADYFLRAVAAALASPNGEIALQATIDFLQQLLNQATAANPPDAPTESDAPPDPDK